MKILFLFGGGKWDSDASTLANAYFSRVRRYADVDVRLITSREKDPMRAQKEESQKILDTLSPDDYVVLFDERGTEVDSNKFTQIITRDGTQKKRLVIIVGGAWGVTDAIRTRADKIISFSLMIFPHDLARIMATEQVYRAFSINAGSHYHHR